MIPTPRNTAPWGLIRVTTPATESDPNALAVLTTNARVFTYDGKGYGGSTAIVTILGGTSLTGRFWRYDNNSSMWLMLGNIVTCTTAGAAGSQVTFGSTASNFSSFGYFQVLTNTGSVTDCFYGLN